MSSTLPVNLSRKINPETVKVLTVISQVCAALDVAWVIVGATARDLVLHHAFGAKVTRATYDIDFAVEVADWESFQQVKGKLIEQGFRESQTQHRLYGRNDETIDLVPFGQIENNEKTIAWPPKGEVAMNVLGFSEACEYAVNVIIDDQTELTVPVATPVGMILLKIIAWTDRVADMRRKDAVDIKYILENYELIPSVTDQAYEKENTDIMEAYGWDLTLASVHLLGRHAREVSADVTHMMVSDLFEGKITKRSIEDLAMEMSQNQAEHGRNVQLLNSFSAGFKG